MNQQPVSIIIPVYKNYIMFFKFLEINKKYFSGCEVVIMNDYPLEDITDPVKKIFPDAVVFNNKKNLGFAGNVNLGVTKTTRDYIFLMNSDVILKDNTFLQALNHFKDNKKIFAVGFAQVEKNGKIVGSNRGYFKDGLINHSSQLIPNPQSLIPNFWAEGGSSIFDKKIFIELGMFDELFNPFYWEDVDLSYRAWKRGYQIIFDSSIQVEHHHESTIGKYFNQSRILKTAFRNQLIFNWKNLTDEDLLSEHILAVYKYIFRPGFFQALIMFPKILQSRKKTIKLYVKSDRDILDKFK